MIEKKNGLIKFLKYGEKVISGLKLEDKISDIVREIGEPKVITGNGECGYYMYKNGLRIGYTDDSIDEFAILFLNKKNVRFSINISAVEYLNEISRRTTIHEFIKILNFSKIKWRSCDEKSKEIFTIITEGDVLVLFSLENGRLYRIVYSQISKGIGSISFLG